MAVEGQSGQRSAGIDAATRDEIQLTFGARLAIIGLIGLAGLVAPGLEGQRTELVGLAAIAVPLNLALWRLAMRTMSAIGLVIIADTVLLVIACILVPPLCLAAMIILAAALVSSSAFVAVGYPLIAGVVGTVGFVLAVPDQWLSIVVGFGATFGSVFAVSQSQEASQARGRYFGHLLRGGSIVPLEVDAQTGAVREIGSTIEALIGTASPSWDDDPHHHLSLLHPDDHLEWSRMLQDLVDRTDTSGELRLRRADGTWLWIRADFEAVLDLSGAPLGRGLLMDVSREHAITVTNARYSHIIDRIPAVVATFRVDDGLLLLESANPEARRLIPELVDLVEPIAARTALPWLPEEAEDLLLRAASETTATRWDGVHGLLPGGDADRVFDVKAFALAESGLAVVLTDVTERHHRAEHDELTDAFNREGLRRRTESELRDRGPGDFVALLSVEITDFDTVMNTLGLAGGDEVLIALARRLEDLVGRSGAVGRSGTDRFDVMVPTADVNVIRQVARALADAVRRPLPVAGMEVGLGVSVGVAVAPVHATEAEPLITCAALARGEAATSGHTLADYRPEIDRTSVRRLRLAGELRAAIRDGQVRPHYQPKFTLPGRVLSGAEALVRWHHPSEGLLAPAEFLDLAQVGGLLPELTAAVVDHLLVDFREFDTHLPDLVLSFNLSVGELFDPIGLEQLIERFVEADVPRDRIQVEITEEQLMVDIDRAITAVRCLRSAGLGVSIDDFGTGYSSMAYLAQLPVTEVKIDRSLIAGVHEDKKASTVVSSIITLAHDLDLTVVAEGIEDERTLTALTALRCDAVQGYLLGRPVESRTLAEGMGPSDPASVDQPIRS